MPPRCPFPFLSITDAVHLMSYAASLTVLTPTSHSRYTKRPPRARRRRAAADRDRGDHVLVGGSQDADRRAEAMALAPNGPLGL